MNQQNDLEQQLARLMARTAETVAALLEQWLRGTITRSDLDESLALAVSAARVRAGNIGAALIQREVEQATGRPSPAIPPPASRTDDISGARQAVATITAGAAISETVRKVPGRAVTVEGARLVFSALLRLSDDEQDAADTLAMRLLRLLRGESARAAQDGAAHTIATDERIRGWVRDLNGDACRLCEWWSRGGRVWPADHVMPRHKGCECQPRPVLVDYQPTVGRRAAARSDRDRQNQQKENAA